MIQKRQPQLEAFHAAHLAIPTANPEPRAQPVVGTGVSGDDQAVIDLLLSNRNGTKNRRLWEGDITGHDNNWSSADLALCGSLAFYTGDDPERLDRIFRSSGLMRPKWDDPHYANGDTYGQVTIDKAIKGCSSFYQEVASGDLRDKESSTDRLLAMVHNDGVLFFRDERNEPHAQFPIGEHLEVWPLKSDWFKSWLAYRYYQKYQRAPHESGLKDAIRSMAAPCLFEGEPIPLGVRIVSSDNAIVIDLGDSLWQMIQVTSDGWEVSEQ